jgi:YesN/AraC family two-component response regulator
LFYIFVRIGHIFSTFFCLKLILYGIIVKQIYAIINNSTKKGIKPMLLDEITILFVDDDHNVQDMIGTLLKSYCKEVFLASDGKEGLELYQDKQPDIVISDITMPNMCGLEMSQEIKKINPNQIISLFTARDDSSYKDRASQIGIDTFLQKPLDEEQFFNSLHYLAMSVERDIEEMLA